MRMVNSTLDGATSKFGSLAASLLEARLADLIDHVDHVDQLDQALRQAVPGLTQTADIRCNEDPS